MDNKIKTTELQNIQTKPRYERPEIADLNAGKTFSGGFVFSYETLTYSES